MATTLVSNVQPNPDFACNPIYGPRSYVTVIPKKTMVTLGEGIFGNHKPFIAAVNHY